MHNFLDVTKYLYYSFKVFCLFIKDNNNNLSTFQTGKIHENFHNTAISSRKPRLSQHRYFFP